MNQLYPNVNDAMSKAYQLIKGLLFSALLLWGNNNAFSETIPNALLGSAMQPIRVGVINKPPFAIYQDNALSGLVVDIFKAIAEKQHWHYNLILLDQNIEAAINDVVAKKYDILIGPMIVTNDRIKRINYGRPFFLSEIKLGFNTQSASLADAFYNVLKTIPLAIMIAILIGMLIISNVIWFVERAKNPEIPKTYFKGFFFSLWVFITHFLGGGMFYTPKSVAARAALMLWFVIVIMFTLTISSTYTAYLTARIISAHDPVRNVHDLAGKKLAYIKGEAYVKFIHNVLAIPVAKPDLKSALKAVEDREVFGVVEDSLILSRAISEWSMDDLEVSGFKFSNNEFAFIYPMDSPIRNSIDQSLVEMRFSGEMNELCKLYLADKYVNCEF
ncbi:glutamine ABC transporter periplasmic protein [Legionella maceachernii]|uniref:Glutamine ABC transporter periplasmic protein n=4 Tax=Legionella TaxID=445 RepID=A0A0W0WDS3_9GAMM|nr:transporter substrate-binding domain-containing protein [Legionella maceachernii]KTD30509.1 glutamine ABC transporter periplasmic protein [Legionella maceachernii]SKA16855.1 amino acid ABC transporter substrate-binding protein, PAAT family [Legionella maceachernii]SUP01723.1 glutamine ABC transporter periplasmic protein [Legionella maceachernii]